MAKKAADKTSPETPEKNKTPDNFKLWQNRIKENGKKLKEQAKEWDKFECAYEGDIVSSEMTDFESHLTAVNYPYVDVRSSVPKLYSQSPFIYIDPETPESDHAAEALEMVVNIQKDKVWFLSERMDSLVKEAKLSGRGYTKVSYKFEKDKIGREFDGEAPNDEISIAFLKRKELIIPCDAKSFKSARWVAHEIQDVIGDMRKKFGLQATDVPTVLESADLPDDMPLEEKEDFQYGTYYEIEDRVARTLSIIVEGVDRFVVEPYPFPYRYYSMYDELEWNQIPGKLDTKADFHFWWKLLIELNETKNQQNNHRRKLNAKYKWVGTDPTAEQERDLKSYNDSQIVKLKAGQDVVPFQHATVGPEVYQSEQSTLQYLTVVSGLNEMKQGLPQSQKTAREAMAIVSESQDVLSYRANRVEKLVASVVKKCVILMQDNYDKTRVFGLTEMDEVEFLNFKDKFKEQTKGNAKRPFVAFTKDDFKGKISVKVKPGSAMPADENQRKQDIAQYVELVGKSKQLEASTDWVELSKEIAKGLHIENKGIIISPQTPEQENSLLKRNIPLTPRMNEPHDEHLATHLRESNNTHAYLMHIMAHNLMKEFIGQAPIAPSAPMPGQSGQGGLSQENIGGFPQGALVPPVQAPQQPASASMPSPQPEPPSSGLPN